MPDHDVFARDMIVADTLKVMRALDPRPPSSMQEGLVRSVLTSFLLGPRQGDLFASPTREGVRFVQMTKDMMCGERAWRDHDVAVGVKVALIIGHLRGGRRQRVGAGELARVAPVTSPDVPGEGGDGAGEVAGTDVVEFEDAVGFSFAWRCGPGRRNGWSATAHAHAEMSEVAPVDAPVACSLWTPEGRIDVRRLGSEWLRPVLAPGRWTPVGVAEFRDAARDGVAWRDNPFLARVGGGVPAFHLLDYAEPRPLGKGDEGRVTEARDACLARAGRLHVIDGVVHRSSGPPVAGFVTTYAGGTPVTVPAWRMDELGSTQDMATFGGAPAATWFDGRFMPDPSGRADPDGCLVPLPDWISVARSMTYRGHARRDVTPPVDDLVWRSDAFTWSPDPLEVLRVASGMAVRLVPLAHALDLRADPTDPLVRLKQALAGLEADQGAGPMTVLRTLCAEVLTVVAPMTDPRAGMWSYVASLAAHAAGQGHAPNQDPQLVEVRF